VISLVACDSSSNKILGLIELGKTTRRDLFEELNLQIECTEVWDEAVGIYRYNYIWDYADYTLNNVNGTIRIKFTDDDTLAQFVNYSVKATSENMEQLMSYLTDTYGKSYEQIDDYTTRWVSENFTIDYVLTDKDTIEVRWYNAE
jgi:hypothetical protein